jgi:NhaA family Na+:H+ antiporter
MPAMSAKPIIMPEAHRGTLPEGTTWKQVYAVSRRAGIGFTMSLLIANLGFGDGERVQMAKYGILTGSVIAGAAGCALLRLTTRRSPASL